MPPGEVPLNPLETADALAHVTASLELAGGEAQPKAIALALADYCRRTRH